MDSQKAQVPKKRAFPWIILILIVLLAGGYGVYTHLDWLRPAPVAQPAIVRGKIPSMPAPVIPTEKPSAQSETVPTAGVPAIAGPNPPGPGPLVAAAGDAKTGAVRTGSDPIPIPKDPEPAAGETTLGKSMETATTDPPAFIHSQADNQSADTPGGQAQETAPLVSKAQQPALAESPGEPAAARESKAETARPGTLNGSTLQMDSEKPAPFTIQVGAYREKANADQMVEQLNKKGYDAYVFQRIDKKGQVLHLVRFGEFQDRTAAAQALTVFKDQEHMDAGIAATSAK